MALDYKRLVLTLAHIHVKNHLLKNKEKKKKNERKERTTKNSTLKIRYVSIIVLENIYTIQSSCRFSIGSHVKMYWGKVNRLYLR